MLFYLKELNSTITRRTILFTSFIVFYQGMRVPWKKILTSLPAWSIGITTFGRIWIHYVFIIPGPMYMKTVLGFSIQAVS